ncbi:hypothetical protein N7513_000093 [Penicillium frequentans]|nr:hypothetical protein N7513_000093 [Penicillium glabrum]
MKRKVLEPKSANVNLSSPNKARASLHPDKKLSLPMVGNENTVSPQKPKELEKPRGQRDVLNSQSNPSNRLLYRSRILQSSSLISWLVVRMWQRRPDPPDAGGAVVSYAEPNLRDKMRRPTKELIDAVGQNGSRRSSSFLLDPQSLGEAGGMPHAEESAISPCPQLNKIPVNLNPAHLATRDETSHHLLDTVSQRRQSRRHSSNPKTTTRATSPPRDISGTGGSPSPVWKKSPPSTSSSFMPTDGSEHDDLAWQSSAMDAGYRRETRVAARRKSMMV